MQALIWLDQFGELMRPWAGNLIPILGVTKTIHESQWVYVLLDHHVHKPFENTSCCLISIYTNRAHVTKPPWNILSSGLVTWFVITSCNLGASGQACRDAHAWPALGFLSDDRAKELPLDIVAFTHALFAHKGTCRGDHVCISLHLNFCLWRYISVSVYWM